jgi:hypothetical protein
LDDLGALPHKLRRVAIRFGASTDQKSFGHDSVSSRLRSSPLFSHGLRPSSTRPPGISRQGGIGAQVRAGPVARRVDSHAGKAAEAYATRCTLPDPAAICVSFFRTFWSTGPCFPLRAFELILRVPRKET